MWPGITQTEWHYSELPKSFSCRESCLFSVAGIDFDLPVAL